MSNSTGTTALTKSELRHKSVIVRPKLIRRIKVMWTADFILRFCRRLEIVVRQRSDVFKHVSGNKYLRRAWFSTHLVLLEAMECAMTNDSR